ncbi:hypothetical protein BUZ14_07790 [Staphylococcus gallinarum]|uniref:DUF4889 domain-containing protein n=1 Tax=Staphylococcus gallinarum TaxID=1293 RepID=A0A3A0W1M7_STAGA|nr:hypothetical protein [Staphylococcus gallinarum]RIP33949.1 hypothetical protein BUZ14_07790 [Staphylococcus gallinarum]
MRRLSMIIGYLVLLFIIILLFILLLNDKSTIYYGKVENNQGMVNDLVSDDGDIIEHLKISKDLQDKIDIGDYIVVKLSNKKNNIISEKQIDGSNLSMKILNTLNI